MRPSWGMLVQTVAVSVATVLGTGILGLPVSLYSSGLGPFVLSFTFTLFAQIGVIIAMTEVLQRSHFRATVACQVDAESHHNSLRNGSIQSTTDYTALPTSSIPVQNYHPPTLHSMAEHFIPNVSLRLVFNFLVLSHFLFILTAYALAGPQAYNALFPVLSNFPKPLGPPIFVIVLALLVIFALPVLLPALTWATACKGGLLTFLVIVTFIRGLTIHRPIHDDWSLAVFVEPFLMGTLALSGIVNLMPVTFQACLDSVEKDAQPSEQPLDAAFVRAYRAATVAAVVLCYVLNVAWCVAVLLCVPQTRADISRIAVDTALHAVPRTIKWPTAMHLQLDAHFFSKSNATLSDANANGLISTVPLIDVLKARGGRWDAFVALLVNSFIVISVTISFLVMSIGMKHFVDGESRAQSSRSTSMSYDSIRGLKYVFYFSLVFVTATLNPKGVLKIMAGFTSLSLNLEAGVFVMYMLYESRRLHTTIPAPLSSTHAMVLLGFVGLYFTSAVLIDAVLYVPNMMH